MGLGRLIVGALALVLLAACVSGNAVAESEPLAGPLLPSLEVGTFRDSVEFVLQVTNTAEQPVNVTFPSGQSFDFEVWQDGEQVWRWSADRFFTQAVRNETLASGETETYRAVWTPAGGTSGEFRVVGKLTASDHRVQQETRFRLP